MDRNISNLSIDILDFTFQPKPFCEYLGVIVDDKLKFFSPYTVCSIKTRSSLV